MSPVEPERRIALLGSGVAVPGGGIGNDELEAQHGLAPGTILRRCGVRRRYFAEPGDTADELGAQACRHALADASIEWDDIDCLVAASGTMDQAMPCNAALIHRALGRRERRIPAFDINASCLGFLTALDTVSWSLQAGRFDRILVVSADIASCGLDWRRLEASGIFGDGAAAIVLGAPADGEASRILAYRQELLPEGAELCRIRAGGSRHHPSRGLEDFSAKALFEMDGRRLFRLVSSEIRRFVDELLASAGCTLDDIDWIVPHQASLLAMEHLSERLGFARDRVVNIFASFGNQIAASLPTALHTALKDGRIRSGNHVLLLGTGAGVSLAGMVLEY